MHARKTLLLAVGFLFASTILNIAIAADDEYDFILGARGNPYWAIVTDGIKHAAKDKNMHTEIFETDNDTDADSQLNLCMTTIQRKPKVLVMEAMNPSVGIQCFKQATAVGIIVADIDAHLSVDEAAKNGFTLAFTVGSNNVLAGHKAAQYVATIAGKSNPKILIIEGAAGNVNSKKRVDGFRDGIKDILPSAIIVASISAEWDRLKAMNITADTLQRQPDLDIIYCANDGMALGAAEALRNANKPSVKLIGIDGIAAARKAVEDGHMTATVAQLPYLMGIKVVELAYDATHGQKFDQITITPTPVLTADVLKANTEPLLRYVH